MPEDAPSPYYVIHDGQRLYYGTQEYRDAFPFKGSATLAVSSELFKPKPPVLKAPRPVAKPPEPAPKPPEPPKEEPVLSPTRHFLAAMRKAPKLPVIGSVMR